MIRGRQVIGTIGIMGGVATVPTAFARSLEQLRAYTERHVTAPNEEALTIWAASSYHAAARNSLAHNAVGEWTLMLDTDQSFAPDLLGKLLRTLREHELDVVTGVYYQKFAPHLPLLYRVRDDEAQTFQIISEYPKDRPFRVGGCGAGCLLVRNAVFGRMEAELGEAPFDVRLPYSEDLSFCRRLLELGIELWCEPRAQTAHLRYTEVTHEDHDTAVAGLDVERYPALALEAL